MTHNASPMLSLPNAASHCTGRLTKFFFLNRAQDSGVLAFLAWQAMQADGVVLRYFHEEFLGSHGEYRGDLACFVQHYLLSSNRDVLLVLRNAPEGTPEATDILGMIDFALDAPHRQAKIGIWMRRGTTEEAREAGVNATRLAFCILPIDTIFGMSPHPYILRFAKRCGWAELPSIPRYYVRDGQPAPVYIVFQTRETCEEELRHG